MKQKLMAVAVAGALAVPGLAFAQANVQIYGALDLRFDSMKFESSGAAPEATKQHLHGTAPRWGLRGTENLGGGMTAFFQVESGLGLDGRPQTGNVPNGVNLMGGRDTYLGLSSTQWGALQGGGFATPYLGVSQVWSVVPTFGHAQIIMGNDDTTGQSPSPNCAGILCAQAEGSGQSFARRQSDQLQYTSPAFAGLVFRAALAMPELESNDNAATNAGHKPQIGSYSLTWSGGPFSVAGGFEQHRGFRAVAGGPNSAKDQAFTIGGRWNYGMGLLGIGYERIDYDNAAAGAGDNSFKLDNWVVNGTFNVGPSGVVSAGYSRTAGAKECGATASAWQSPTQAGAAAAAAAANMGPAACGGAGKADIFSLAYDHRLSKRTAVYAAYGRIDNGAATTYYYIAGPTSNLGTGQTSGNVPAGVDVKTIAVGVKHTF